MAAYEWHPASQLTPDQAEERLVFLRQHGFRTVYLDASRGAPGPVSFNRATKPAAFHVIDMLRDLRRAYLVVMSYRNFAKGFDGTIFHAWKEFVYASVRRAKCGLVIGQQFTEVEPAKITFHGLEHGRFATAAQQLVRFFGHAPQFRGLAVDDLDAYMDIQS